mmetsp:Transcript_8918/g.26196  ORF Transcript_8918/g.26196 Transcript_8918/m.26196 type:complete len:217 (-) Transcript_8918:116-766(-)
MVPPLACGHGKLPGRASVDGRRALRSMRWAGSAQRPARASCSAGPAPFQPSFSCSSASLSSTSLKTRHRHNTSTESPRPAKMYMFAIFDFVGNCAAKLTITAQAAFMCEAVGFDPASSAARSRGSPPAEPAWSTRWALSQSSKCGSEASPWYLPLRTPLLMSASMGKALTWTRSHTSLLLVQSTFAILTGQSFEAAWSASFSQMGASLWQCVHQGA